ncbi:hypothetical protein HPP92_018932 [Vanilla planifolia]|uniref:DUF7086 domain-containing protein n=1 Tax=Vanilla planifolia TaxID=51239 RepID=A0A835UKH3_VANPL|nr:hypothetical protein HPP92_018932 [Vanilla planifolia]
MVLLLCAINRHRTQLEAGSDETESRATCREGRRKNRAPFSMGSRIPRKGAIFSGTPSTGDLPGAGNYICGNCGHKVTAEYDVETEFGKLLAFMAANEAAICNNSLPNEWREPVCPSCPMCSKVMKPEAAETMEKTNWLFLLLGQTIGHLDLTLLRYFCKHNEVHRTGSKDRLVCSTYLTLCSQLDPRVNHIRMN